MKNKTQLTQSEYNTALEELIVENLIALTELRMGHIPAQPQAKACRRGPSKSKRPIQKIGKVTPVSKPKASVRPGRYSILAGLEIGDSKTLYGHSKTQVFSAISRRSRTHSKEEFGCFPVEGSFEVVRLK